MKKFLPLTLVASLFACIQLFIVSPTKAEAYAPDMTGRVITAGTNAPVAGVWVKWSDGIGGHRYAQTDSNGVYYYVSIATLMNANQIPTLQATPIDTNLDGVNDDNIMYDLYPTTDAADWDFSCGSNDHTFEVVPPVGIAGTFSSINKIVLANAAYQVILPDIIFTPATMPTPTPNLVFCQKMIVPAYIDPANPNNYEPALSTGSGIIKGIVLDPSNGPGASVNPNYINIVSKIRSFGKLAIGYIDVNYGLISEAVAKADIDKWFNYYGVTDIFVDETPSSLSYISYVADLYNYIKSRASGATIIFNSGTDPAPALFSIGGIWGVFEGSYDTYSAYSYTQYSDWLKNSSPDRIMNLVYSVPDSAAVQTVIDKSRTLNVGNIYAINTYLPAVWNSIPPYMNTEITSVNGTCPVTGPTPTPKVIPPPIPSSGTLYYIKGDVFVDTNRDGVYTWSTGESRYKTAVTTVTITNLGNGAVTQLSSPVGNYGEDSSGNGILQFPGGNYRATFTPPAGFALTTPGSFDFRVGPNCTAGTGVQAYCTPTGSVEEINFGFNIGQYYSVNGKVYVDLNQNGVQDPGEPDYPGVADVVASRGVVTTSAGGLYTISNVTEGPVTVSLHTLPPDYYLITPLNGPPPSWQINVGPSCTTGGAVGAVCE